MTDEEIKAIQRERYKEKARIRSKRWHQSEKCKAYNRARRPIEYARHKERMKTDPEYAEHFRRRHRLHPDATVRGPVCTLTEQQKETIARLYGLHYKIATIAREVNEPYGKIYQYIKHHVKPCTNLTTAESA